MRLAVLLVGIALSACSANVLDGFRVAQQAGVQAGTFATISGTAAAALADDGAAVLAQLCPPGQGRVVLQQADESDLGAELEQRLRERGYAVDVVTGKAVPDATFIRFAFDEAGGLFRLTLVVWEAGATQYTVVSRGYQVRRGVVFPAGNWARWGAA
jgi:hypothetical protein